MARLDSVWVVDDDESIRWVLEKGFSENNIDVSVFESAHEVIKKMFSLSRELAALNFLSTYVDFELEKNQHYSPQTIYSHAKDLSSNVNLIDDYPLYEFYNYDYNIYLLDYILNIF